MKLLEQEISLFDAEKYDLNREETFELVTTEDGKLIKTKERVQHHGEVFTPKWMVLKMLAEPAIQKKINDLHATFLEPSAGEGAFLKEILHQKLNYVDKISNKKNWKENALWALMSIYGIELLPDNLFKARTAMFEVFSNHYQVKMQQQFSSGTDLYKSAKYVLQTNIVQGNTLEYTTDQGQLIEFSQWIPIGDKVQRKPFTYKSLFDNGKIDGVDDSEQQLSLFDVEKSVEEINLYKVCPVTKVYRKEQANG